MSRGRLAALAAALCVPIVAGSLLAAVSPVSAATAAGRDAAAWTPCDAVFGGCVGTADLYATGPCTLTAVVAWGDGATTTVTLTDESTTVYHTYAEPGIYTISDTGSAVPTTQGATCTFIPFSFAADLEPDVDAGSPQTVTGTDVLSLQGTASNAATSTAWSEVSGPPNATAQFASDDPATTVTVSAPGTYTFELTATDAAGDTATSQVTDTFIASGIAAVRFAPLSLPRGNDTPGLPVVKDDVFPPVYDHTWGPASCPDGLADPQSYDYVDCASPSTGTPSKDWPVIYPAGADLTIDQAVFFSADQLTDPQLTATAVVTNGQQTLASLTLAPVPLSSTPVDGNYELSTTASLDFTGQLPAQPGDDQLSITWTIESGGDSYPQGTSIHPVYVTWRPYSENSIDGTNMPPYVSLLNIGTTAAAGYTDRTDVINAIWDAFAKLNIDQSVLDPQSGVVSDGFALTYYQNGYDTIGDWWNPSGGQCTESVLRLMGTSRNTCGDWALLLAAVMEYQGIPAEPSPLCVTVLFSKYCPGFYAGPDPGSSYMLIGPKLWRFSGATGGGTFPFADSLTVSSAGVNVNGSEVTYTPSVAPIAQGGIATPREMFLTGDHEIDYIPGWGYADPSYGNPSNGIPYHSVLAYEPTAIAGFAVVYAREDGRWILLPNTISTADLESTCVRYQCQFRAVPYAG
jgi:hypothetical protein